MDNFKLVPYNFLMNLKSLFSTILIILLGNYPILCCIAYISTQFGMTIYWLSFNKKLIQIEAKWRIYVEVYSELILDFLIILPVFFSSLSYSFNFGVVLQIVHVILIVVKFGYFIEGICCEVKMFRSRKKIVGGLERLKYHEDMGYGIIKYKFKF